jgi:reverse gyrase
LKKGKITSEKEATEIVDSIKNEDSWKIKEVKQSEKKRSPYPLFNTSSLQQFASAVYGWSGKKTMSVAQKLYEAGLCLLPGELITLSDGSIHKIEDSINFVNKKLIGFGSDFKTKAASISAYQKIPYKGNIYTIRTKDGQEISGTPDHMYYGYSNKKIGWTKSENFNIGDYVLCSKHTRVKRPQSLSMLDLIKSFPPSVLNKIKVKIKDKEVTDRVLLKRKRNLKESTYYKYKRSAALPLAFVINEENIEDSIEYYLWSSAGSKPEKFTIESFFYILGLILGDGHLTPEHKITFPSCIMDKEKWGAVTREFNGKIKTSSVVLSGQLLFNLCLHYGAFIGKKSDIIFLSPTISGAPNELIYRFIAGLIDSDGCIHVDNNKKAQIVYTTKNPEFAKQLNVLFRSLGYFTGLHHKKDDRDNCSVAFKKVSFLKLIDNIEPYLMARKKQASFLNKTNGLRTANSRDIFNFPLMDYILDLLNEKNITKQKLSQVIFGDSSTLWNYISIRKSRNRPSYIPKKTLIRIAKYLKDDFLMDIAKGDAYFAEISKIDINPYEGFVYDVSTSSENFIANTFYSHNCTYHRTDSLSVSKEAIGSVRDHIKSAYGSNYLPIKPRFFKTKSKSAQEAHEGIRPTDLSVKTAATADETKLYKGIYERFVASQMEEAIFDILKVTVESGSKSHQFQTNGQKLKFDGFLKVWSFGSSKDQVLPQIVEGEDTNLMVVDPSQHFTQPPPSYNDASLVKTLEENGVGRPSTYASIIDTLIKRTYVERQGKKFVPTELGTTVSDFLKDSFPELMNTQYTARIEEKLDEIADGKLIWYETVDDFYNELQKRIGAAKTVKSMKKAEETDITCPTCKKHKLVIRKSRYGEFYGCAGFMEKGKAKCKATFQVGDDGTPIVKKVNYLKDSSGKPFKCDKCGKPVVIRKSTKTGKEFGGCSGFPTCKRMFTTDEDPQPIEFKRKKK